ncbi:Spectinomycin tetracycline efflux pump [Achromobacter denitrificans]|uniref:MFS transporter n=2 Tax=Achromobacter denitrificans TaxID=32002 RepID=UPI000789071A|nr:MFS transporter [Achromobacter denitrificans]OLU00472.1 MFS transporter [Achromobacter denitrificans]QKH42079.1 MFS transporter [Achromobacter denitrificans]QKH50777.1 MFS transporter [Achromobacter denitrificans]CAB3743665.1 Multidrug resistance protein Stp [Achromobacter denitrificans]SUU23394.1 Spectinomycin tetracycline efflux pump [Achromobacter denitrificans]
MHPARRRALVLAVNLGSFITILDISIVNVALPTMQAALRIDMAGLQWVVDAYALFLSAFMLSAGPLGDRYGRKRSWLAGVLLFTAGSALCGLADSLPALLIGRAVQGVAGALLVPGALSLLTQAFPDPKERAQAIGIWASCNAVSLIVGPMLGGVLVAHFNWQSIFLINLPVGALAIALGAWSITESAHPEHAAFDPAGQALSVLWLGALTFGLIAAGEHGWAAPQASGALAVAAAGLLAFLWVEHRASRPILPLGLFRDAGFAITNFASFVLGFSAYSSLFFFSLYLQHVQGLSPLAAGWQLAPQFAAAGLVSVVFGRLNLRFGLPRLMVAGYVFIGVAMLGMTAFETDTPYAVTGSLLVLLGLGTGLAVPSTSMAVMATVPRERSGMASATMNALRQTGMTIGIALLGALMSGRAIDAMAASLSRLGAPEAQAAARAAVTQHVMPEQPANAAALFADALASGFHAAMLAAGAASLVAAVLLLAVARGSRRVLRAA